MTDFCEEKGLLYSFIQRGAPGGLITPFMQKMFPYMFQPYCCPVCGRRLMPHELNGPTTRSLCPSCYHHIVEAYVVETCGICGGGLPRNKVMEQQANPRTIRAKIHEGACMARWVAVHNVAHGEQDVIELIRQSIYIIDPQDSGYGLPEPVYGYDYNQAVPAQRLPAPRRQVQRLPAPRRQGQVQRVYRPPLPVQGLPAPGRQGRRVRRQPLPVDRLPAPKRQALPYPSRQEYPPQQMPDDGRMPDCTDAEYYDLNRYR